ncbi:MAG: lysostaphin resistance A-like protein [Clostridium sp.]|uniref:CPBP family intramembrane glutamic endopeptidase n=1 Tax=Clostridium sp. TaxID=1506 RepID=UPI003D6D4E98
MRSKKILLANSLLILALILFVLVPIIVNTLFNLGGSLGGDISLLLSGVTTVITFGGITLLYCRITKRGFSEVMVIKKISIKQLITIMFVAFGTYIFAVGVNSVSMKLFPIAIEDGMKISNLLNNSSTLLGLIVVVLVPAFFEEIFFRGVLLDAYEGLNRKIKYFIITLIFATFHGNIMQIVYVMFLGFIILKVREYSGSLVGSMTFHAANNAISFVLSKVVMIMSATGIKDGVLDPAQVAATNEVMNASFIVVILRASLFFLIGGAILFINLRKLKEYKEKKNGLELEKNNTRIYDKPIDKKQYIPLVIYFVSITLLVISRYYKI